MGAVEPGRARRRGRDGAAAGGATGGGGCGGGGWGGGGGGGGFRGRRAWRGETQENSGEIIGGGGDEPVEGLLGVEPGKAGEGGLGPARRRSGREDEQVAGAELEVMIADEGGGREAEGTAGGPLPGEGRKVARGGH